MVGECVEVISGNVPLSGFGEAVEKRPLKFRQQEPVLVGGVLAEVIGHELVEPGHQALNVDEPVGVPVPLPFEQSAGVRQTADLVYEAVVVEVVDKEGSIRNERPRETGSGYVYVLRRGWRRHALARVARIGQRAVRRPGRNRLASAVSPTPKRRGER